MMPAGKEKASYVMSAQGTKRGERGVKRLIEGEGEKGRDMTLYTRGRREAEKKSTLVRFRDRKRAGDLADGEKSKKNVRKRRILGLEDQK